MFQKKKWQVAMTCAWGLIFAPSSHAHQDGKSFSSAHHLEPIAVIATKSDEFLSNIPNSVSVIDYEEIKRKNSSSIKDLFEEELDVEVRSQNARYGISAGTGRSGQESINIRGLEGNQVLLMIDGIPMAQSFQYGAASTGRVDYLDLEGISHVEILRGPHATQYGSDGLAGAINFQTLSIDQLLVSDLAHKGYAKTSYRSVNDSSLISAAWATRLDDGEVLVLGSGVRGHETKNQGIIDVPFENRTKSNPENNQQNYLLAKYRKHLSSERHLLFTIEDFNKNRSTELYSGRNIRVKDLDAHDEIQRQRLSLDWVSSNSIFGFEDESSIKWWWQKFKTHQLTFEEQTFLRTRENLVSQESIGLKTQWTNKIQTKIPQKWIYGIDWQHSALEQSMLRAGDYSGQIKYYPDTVKKEVGIFAQVELETSSLTWIPAIRFDRYSLSPKTSGYALSAVHLSDSAWSPSISGIWKYQPEFHPYFSWARGFKAPTQDQINNGFSNLRHGYTSIGNPDLKSEKSSGLEWGVKGQIRGLRYSGAVFNNHYQNFIEQQLVGGTGRPSDPRIYQYINHTKANIYGTDLRVDAYLNNDWRLTSAWVRTKGYQESTEGIRSPLDTISPMRVALGLAYQKYQWEWNLYWSHTWEKKGLDVGSVTDVRTRQQVEQFVAPAYSVIHLQSQWRVKPDLTLQMSINNLLDKKYWRWADVRGIEASSPVIDAYTAPGRNVSVTLRYDF